MALGTAPRRVSSRVWVTASGRRLTADGAAYWESHYRQGSTDGQGHVVPIGRTLAQFPALKSVASKIGYVASAPHRGPGIEFYPKGERDSPTPQRPTLRTFGRVPPKDVAGDIVSHFAARGVDPTLTSYYNRFVKSLTPDQHMLLQQRYKQEGDTRPFAQWARVSGIPAFFRGHAFKQLQANETHYTPEQVSMFDEMNGYLRGNVGIGGGISASFKPETPRLEAASPHQIAQSKVQAQKDRADAHRLGLTPAAFERRYPYGYQKNPPRQTLISGFPGAKYANVALSPLGTVADLAVDAPAGTVLAGKLVGQDFSRAYHKRDFSFKGTRLLGRSMASQVGKDFTDFSYSRSLLPVADVAGVLAPVVGTGARFGAAVGRGGIAVKAAEDAGRLAKLRAAAHYLDVRKPLPGRDFPDRQYVYGGQVIPGVYSRAPLTRGIQRVYDRALGLTGTNPVEGRGGTLVDRLRAGKVGKELAANQRVEDRLASAPASALDKAGRRLSTPQQEAIRFAAEGVPAAERVAYHQGLSGARHERRAGIAETAAGYLHDTPLGPEINPAAAASRSLFDRLRRRGVSGERLATLYGKTAESAGRREQTLQDVGLSDEEQFAGRVQGPGRVFKGAKYLDPKELKLMGIPADLAAEMGGLVGAEDFAAGKFRVPATLGRTRAWAGRATGAIRRPGRPPSLRRPFTGRMIEQGTHAGPSTHLVARSEQEAQGLANTIRRVKQLGAMGVDQPGHGLVPVILNPRIHSTPAASAAMANAERGAVLTSAERRALGSQAESLRRAALPDPASVQPGMKGVKYVPHALVSKLGLAHSNVETSRVGSLLGRGMDNLNRAATAGVLYAHGSGYAIPQLIGNEMVRFADQGLLGPVRGAQAAKLWHGLDEEGKATLGALAGTHSGVVGSILTDATGPVSATVNKIAGLFGKVIDSPLRIPSVVHHMVNQGYDATPEGLGKLLQNHDDLVRVGRRAHDNSIDFSRLGPLEQKFARRLAWFYPWLKASTLYAGHIAREHPSLSAGILQSGQYGDANNGLVDQPYSTRGTFKIAGKGNRPWTINPASSAIVSSWAQEFNTLRHTAFGGLRPGESVLDWQTPAIAAFTYGILRVDPFTQEPAPPTTGALDAIVERFPPNAVQTLLHNLSSGGSKQFPMSKRDALLRYAVGSVAPRREDQAVTAGYKRKEDRALMTHEQRIEDDHTTAVANAVADLRASGIVKDFKLPADLKEALAWQRDQNQYRLSYQRQNKVKKMGGMDNLTADLEALLKLKVIDKPTHDSLIAAAKLIAANPSQGSLARVQGYVNAAFYNRNVISAYRTGVKSHNRKPGF